MSYEFYCDDVTLTLPDHIQSITNTASFKRQLKTFLFSACSYYIELCNVSRTIVQVDTKPYDDDDDDDDDDIANGNKTCRRLFTRVIFLRILCRVDLSGLQVKVHKMWRYCRATIYA